MGHVVKAPLVIMRTQDGGYVHLYDGQPVPGNADPKDVKRLAGEGYLTESDAENLEPEDEPVAEGNGPVKPTGNASHAAWSAYAVESGQATEDEARSLTRDELRDLYG